MQEQAIIHNRETELFKYYELKGWQLNPRIYKILAASILANIFIVVGLAKANFLTAKSCDTPFVSGVCAVLDTLYVGSELLSADGEFVSKDYDKTELSDEDEIIMVDMTGEYPPLTYPAGYFALANPEQSQALTNDPNLAFPTQTDITSIPTSPKTDGTNLLNVTPTLPQQNNNVIQGDLPSSPLGSSATPTFPKNRKFPRTTNPTKTNPKNESPKTLPNLNGDTTADKDKTDPDKKPIESETVKEIEINKKPFEDLGDTVNAKLEKKEVDLNQPFLVVMDGTITADGKLDRTKSTFIKSEGDKEMVNIAKSAIEAVGDSKFLAYLKNQGVDKVNFTLAQDGERIYVKLVSDQKTAEKAKTTASGFSAMLSLLKLGNLDENSKTLVENSKVTSDGKNFVLDFTIPKADAQVLIKRSLEERAQKKASQPNTKTEINGSETNAQAGK